MPFWSTDIGKYYAGIDVKYNRKFSWISVLILEFYSIIFYIWGIHVFARWQFWSKTHLPDIFAFEISLVAGYPWPWPNDITYISIFNYLVNLKRELVGSAPGDNTKIIGVLLSESFHKSFKEIFGDTKYFSPIVWEI